MMIKMTIDTDGRPTGFYMPGVHGENIPEDAIAITNEQWQDMLENPGRRRWDGSAIASCDPPPPIVMEPPVILVNDIHMAWFRAALAEAGKLAAVNQAVASLGPVKQALWEYTTSIRIDDPDVIAVAAALDIDLRATFDRAAEIRDERRPV